MYLDKYLGSIVLYKDDRKLVRYNQKIFLISNYEEDSCILDWTTYAGCDEKLHRYDANRYGSSDRDFIYPKVALVGKFKSGTYIFDPINNELYYRPKLKLDINLNINILKLAEVVKDFITIDEHEYDRFRAYYKLNKWVMTYGHLVDTNKSINELIHEDLNGWTR